MELGTNSSRPVAWVFVIVVLVAWCGHDAEAQVWGDHLVRCLELSSDDGTTTACICETGDRLWHDSNCDRTKDSGEEFIAHTDGSNCAAGEIPLGVDAQGAVQGCYEPVFTDITGGTTRRVPFFDASGVLSSDSTLLYTHDTTKYMSAEGFIAAVLIAGTVVAAGNTISCDADNEKVSTDGTGAIGCDTNTHLATAITDGLIVEADLNEDSGSPTDEDVLTYDSTGANFNWVAQSSIASLAGAVGDVQYRGSTAVHDAEAAFNYAEATNSLQVGVLNVGPDDGAGAFLDVQFESTGSACQGSTPEKCWELVTDNASTDYDMNIGVADVSYIQFDVSTVKLIMKRPFSALLGGGFDGLVTFNDQLRIAGNAYFPQLNNGTAAGNDQSTALQLACEICEIRNIIVTTADGVKLPECDSDSFSGGLKVIIHNTHATVALEVFPFLGGDIGAGTNINLTLAALDTMYCSCWANAEWHCISADTL